MKLELPKISSKTNAILQEQFFGIGNPALVMDLLRTKLYADCQLATFREVACNALDANVENNKAETPIEVTLPTSLSPTLIVSDSGIGLSPQRVKEIYTQYGNSTKRDTNDQIGSMGFGSKSPWSLTDSFIVVTIHNNIKYTYSCYIDSSRLGKICLLDKSDTDLPSGTSIQIPVQQSDIEKFYDRVRHITCFWKVKPKFHGRQVHYSSENRLFSGDNWYCSNSASISSFIKTTSAVILSSIPYDLDAEKVGLSSKDQELLKSCRFRLFFNTGDLSISGGRDSLHYDTKTNTAIKARLEEIKKSINQSVSSSITNAATYIEAVTKSQAIRQQYRDVFLNALVPTWQGIPLHTEVTQRELPNLVVHQWQKTYSYHSKYVIARNANFRIPVINSNVKVILNDLNTDKVPSYLTENFLNNHEVLVVSLNSETKKDLTWDQYPEKKLLDQLVTDKLSNYKITVTARDQGDRIQASEGNILAYDLKNGRSVVNIPNNDFVYTIWDYKEGVFRDDQQPKVTGRRSKLQFPEFTWKDYHNTLLQKEQQPLLEDFLGNRVFGLTEKRVVKAKRAIPFTKALAERIKEVDAKFPQALRQEVELESNYLDSLGEAWVEKLLKVNHPAFENFKKICQHYHTLGKELTNYKKILAFQGVYDDIDGEGTKVKAEVDGLYTKYPLLKELTGWTPATILTYVEMAEKTSSNI